MESTTVSQLSVVLAALKEFDCADLFAVVKASTLALEKATKTVTKAAPKAGSAPKGVQPAQLAKPRAWVEFTLQHARENGWEEFVISKGEEEIVMSASEEHNGAHIYSNSMDEKNPNGKQILLTHAMSLSKQRWSTKTGMGTHEELYKEFSEKFNDSQPVSAVSSASSTPKTGVIRKTAAEKASEKESAKLAKEAEKAAAKLVKEAEKAAAKASKEVEKAAAKLAKEAEKAAAKASKEAEKAATPKMTVVKAAVKKPVAVKAVVAWSCPADGAVHPWPYKGKKFLRNSDNQVWEEDADGGCGDWQGVYIETEDRIDDSVEEPSFNDDE